MDPLYRQRLVLGLALIVCLALLGRWAMRSDEAVNARPDAERSSFTSFGYGSTMIRDWNGHRLDLQLQRQKAQ